MSAESILKRFEKTAKRDMPSFTSQDRPKKVKEIYRALKRDHPDMPAEMKARIAARQGKKGKQHQGPPYKAPITKWKEKKSSILGGITGYYAQGAPEKTPRSGFWRGFGGGLIGGTAGQMVARAARQPYLSLPLQLAGELGGGYLGGRTAKLTPEEQKEYNQSQKKGKTKKGSITIALDALWSAYGPNLVDVEKNAAAGYFYELRQSNLNREAFGDSFCKLSEAMQVNPWVLSAEVEDHLPAFRVLAKTASGEQKELAQFYVNWADALEKKAGFFTRMLGGGGMERAAGNLTNVARRSAINPAAAAKAAEEAAKQTVKKDTSSLGHKILGTTIIGGLGLGGLALANQNAQRPAPQPAYY